MSANASTGAPPASREWRSHWPLVLASPHTRLHLYGKREARRGRKMGHYSCLAESSEAALEQALRIKTALLPRAEATQPAA